MENTPPVRDQIALAWRGVLGNIWTSAASGLIIGYLLIATSSLTRNYAPLQFDIAYLYLALSVSGFWIGMRWGDFKQLGARAVLSCAVAGGMLAAVLLAPSFSPVVPDKETFFAPALLEGIFSFGLLLFMQLLGGIVGIMVRTLRWIPWVY
ncbi:MAG: hypothetical protein HY327_05105 [Chloroflexi bacterium]|nr:hypothetical protein [Chloroflexota bacterium]